MNKKIFGFILCLAFVLTPFLINKSGFVNTVQAGAWVLNTTNITSTSATINAVGFNPNQKMTIYVINRPNSQTSSFQMSIDVTCSSSGSASATFTGLQPGGHYNASSSLAVDNVFPFDTLLASGGELDLTNLTNALKAAISVLDSAVEGTSVGQYKVGSKAVLQRVVDTAAALPSMANMNQMGIENGASEVNAALETFQNNKITNINGATPPPGAVTGGTGATTKKVTFKGLVPDCNSGAIDTANNQYANACDFTFFMALINRLIQFALFDIATPFLGLIIIYIGYLYLTSGGSNQTEKAKHILFNVVIGYVIALAAWLIINTIISSLGVDPSINTFMDRINN